MWSPSQCYTANLFRQPRGQSWSSCSRQQPTTIVCTGKDVVLIPRVVGSGVGSFIPCVKVFISNNASLQTLKAADKHYGCPALKHSGSYTHSTVNATRSIKVSSMTRSASAGRSQICTCCASAALKRCFFEIDIICYNIWETFIYTFCSPFMPSCKFVNHFLLISIFPAALPGCE